MQEPSGFLGHMIYWHQALPMRPSDVLQSKPTFKSLRPHMSALIQPTFLAQTLERIYEGTKDKRLLDTFLPSVIRYHRWLHKNRKFDHDGLITTISPFESGMDFKPSYDQILSKTPGVPLPRVAKSSLYWRAIGVDMSNFMRRYRLSAIRKRGRFLVKDVLVNTVYSLDTLALARLCAHVKRNGEEKEFAHMGKLATENILKKMYDEKDQAFWDISGKDSIKIRVLTPSILYPIALPDIPETVTRAVVERHLVEAGYFKVPYAIPSVGTSEGTFSPLPSDFIWRGPVWAVHNWFLYRALHVRGYAALADMLKHSLLQLIRKSGFREYYDPFTGKGYGAPNFTWPGLLLDM